MSNPNGSPATINLKLNAPSPSVAFLNVAHTQTFPILNLNLIPDPTNNDSIVEVKVPTKLYERIKQTQLTNKLVLYLSSAGPVGLWTYDMIIATNILSEFGIMSNFKAWIPIAQQSIIKLLSSEKVESNKINAVAFQLAEEILKHLKILDEVISNDLLASTVRDVIERQEMDPDTIISRVGLAIYHSKTLSGQAIFPIIEDEGALYIRFIESEFYKIHKDKFENIMDLPLEARSKTLKVLVAFLVSAYAYYRETSVNNI